jgi:hypothetical protein
MVASNAAEICIIYIICEFVRSSVMCVEFLDTLCAETTHAHALHSTKVCVCMCMYVYTHTNVKHTKVQNTNFTQ